jgi:hypothetical protein
MMAWVALSSRSDEHARDVLSTEAGMLTAVQTHAR